MEAKKHYKLYKSGKKWCCMALTTMAAVIGVATAHQTIHADVTSDSANVQQTSVNTNQNDAQSAVATNASSSDTTTNTNSDVTTNTTTQSDVDSTNSQETNTTKTATNTEQTNDTNSQSNTNTLSVKSLTTDSKVSVQALSASAVSANSTAKNGWYNENGQEVYYENGQTKSGEDYIYVQSMDNANTKNWYLVNNGVAQSGLQKWAGTYYYFNPTSYLKETNTYQQVNWSNGGSSWYMFGNDGAIVSGLYQQDGTYYYYDPSTYLRVTNNYVPVTWSNGGTSWYMFGNDGKIVTGLYKWAGSYYYFSPSTYEKVTNNYIPVTWSDGGTSWYMFGNDGRIVTGLYKWYGSYYYFSPSTYEKVTNNYIPVTWPDGGTSWYMFDETGRIVTGLKEWYGSLYYFSPSTYEKVTNTVVYVNGQAYQADSTGKLSKITSVMNNPINKYILTNNLGHANITSYGQYIPEVTGAYSGTSDGKPNMIVVHETANYNDSITGEINYERSTYENAFVHAFVDANNIIEISNTDHEAWGAAYPANGRAVQFEQVEVHSAWAFARELSNAAYYSAYILHKYNLTPSLAQSNGTGTLWSHHNVSQYLGGTDHTDPDGYWSRNARNYFGTSYNMQDFYELVSYYYNLM